MPSNIGVWVQNKATGINTQIRVFYFNFTLTICRYRLFRLMISSLLSSKVSTHTVQIFETGEALTALRVAS